MHVELCGKYIELEKHQEIFIEAAQDVSAKGNTHLSGLIARY